MIDFHVHTKISDGQYSVTEVLQKAVKQGISVIAITDHDSTGGISEAEKYICDLEKSSAHIDFLKGVELQIEFFTGEFHLLGLGMKKFSKRFLDMISTLQEKRRERNIEIIRLMNEDGIDVTLSEMQSLFSGQIGRPHFAEILVKKNIAKNTQTAFSKYLRRGQKFYVPKYGVNLDEAIVAITESGGAPVVAHPLSLYLSWGKMETALKDFYDRGVVGIEAYHPSATFHACQRLEDLARKIGFFVTAGSDFHGEKFRPDRKLGFSAGGKKIEDRFWTEELKPYLDDAV